ncbi:MAG: aminoglycoside phosphotransferase family protein [bacterium]
MCGDLPTMTDSTPLHVPILPDDGDRPGQYRGARRAFATRLFNRAVYQLDRDISGVVGFIGAGLWHNVWEASVEDERWVLRIPHGPPLPEHDVRLLREARVLNWVRTRAVDLRVPRPVALVHTCFGLASLQTFVPGAPVEGSARVAAVASAARACHRIPVPFDWEWLESYPTRRDHALERLERARVVDLPEARDACAWVEAHLPPDEPASLLHGDLLPQNVLVTEDDTLVAIDWAEAMVGDPAYDFCIVNRGIRRPLGEPDARRRLLDAYHAAGGSQTVTMEHVRGQELSLMLDWLAVEASPQDNDEALNRLRSLLKRTK